MGTVIMSAKECSDNVKENARNTCNYIKHTYGVTPTLAVVLVGDDSASQVYVRNKSKACDFIGAHFFEKILPADSSLDLILNTIYELNNNPDIHGILVQSPVGNLDYFKTLKVFDSIDPRKDVDGFNSLNRARLLTNSNEWYPKPCTPLGIYLLLDYYGIDIQGKNVTIIGRSNIVGKPLACLLENLNATVTLCHSKTDIQDLKEYCQNSDIIVSAVGKANFVDYSFVGDRTRVIVDVGMNRVDGKLCGDVDFDSVNDLLQDRYNDNWITPVPGGVGLMTVGCLCWNLVKCCERLCECES